MCHLFIGIQKIHAAHSARFISQNLIYFNFALRSLRRQSCYMNYGLAQNGGRVSYDACRPVVVHV